MPVGQATPNDLISAAEDYIRSHATASQLGSTFSSSEEAVTLAGTDSALAIESVGTGGSLAVAESVGTALGGLASLSIIPLAILALEITDLILGFARMLAAIKLFGFGRPFWPFANWIYQKVDGVTTGLNSWMTAQVGGMVHSFVSLVDYSLGGSSVKVMTNPNSVSRSEYNHLKTEADSLWTWLQMETERINKLEGFTGQSTVSSHPHNLTTPQVTDHILTTLTQIQGDIANLKHEHASDKIGLENLQKDFTELSKSIYGARPVNYGVQDIMSQIGTLNREVSQSIAPMQEATADNTSSIASLLPLLALSVYGSRGIDNLQRLSDEPCQCPPPVVNNYDLEALLALQSVMLGS